MSALIHAATMVTAGVYLIARSRRSSTTRRPRAPPWSIVGAITLLYGCICAFGQDDLKRVLAYSTVSQIGYMFLAVGLGQGVYAIGIIHLLGHGFFKAALFLSAGSVMHAMNDRINMRRFGGLGRVMPITFGVFLCGYLAIIGFPLATGFFTKDKIIEAAFDKGGTSGWILGIVALLGAGLTAFYMTRALVMTFFGERRWEDDVHPHEAPPIMTVPMIVLGVAVAGRRLPADLRRRRAALARRRRSGRASRWARTPISPVVLIALTLVVVALGVAGAWVAFARHPVPVVQPVGFAGHRRGAPQPLRRRVQRVGADAPGPVADSGAGLPRQPRRRRRRERRWPPASAAASSRLRRSQTGFVRSYALSMLGGSVAVVAVLLAVRFQ